MPNDFIEGEGGEQVLGEGTGENVLPEFQPEDLPPSPSDKFPTTPAACNPLLDAPVEERPCNPESDIETPVIATCAPLNITQTTWTSTKCFTAECPPGLISYILGEGGEQILDEFGNPIIAEYSILAAIGEPVTRCATATSNISQADADAQALDLAQALAEGELTCQLMPVLVELASLNITLVGEYLLVPIVDNATLQIALSGAYELAPLQDNAALNISLTGEYVIIPFVNYGTLSVGISQFSEYQLMPFVDIGTLTLGLSGLYFPVVQGEIAFQDNGTLQLGLTGSYDETQVGESFEESGTLNLDLTGIYSEVAKPFSAEDAGTLRLTLSGIYFQTARDGGSTVDSDTLTLTMNGDYHI